MLLDAVGHEDFNGQALWLKVTIAGVDIGCFPLMPAPYALSLRPGAQISDATTTVQLNRGWQIGMVFYKAGLYSKGSGSSYGVYVESNSGPPTVSQNPALAWKASPLPPVE